MCRYPARDVRRDGEFGEGDPAGVDDVDEQEGLLNGGVDEGVVGGVVGALVGEFEGLIADVQGIVALEGCGWEGTVGVGALGQEVFGLLVGDDCGVAVDEEVGAADVVGVVMGVDEVGDGEVCHVADGVL